MIDEDTRLLMIDQCELLSADTFFIYRSTWDLITKALSWSMQKTVYDIQKRIEVCEVKRGTSRFNMRGKNWQLIIETLKWVIEKTETDPIEARTALGFR